MLPEWGKEENLRSPWKNGYTHAASLSNDATQLDLDFRSIFPLSRIDIGDRIYIRTETEPPSSLRCDAPLSHASPFLKPGNRWQATLLLFQRNICEMRYCEATDLEKESHSNEVDRGVRRWSTRT